MCDGRKVVSEQAAILIYDYEDEHVFLYNNVADESFTMRVHCKKNRIFVLFIV